MGNTNLVHIPIELEALYGQLRILMREELKIILEKELPISHAVPGMLTKPIYKPHEVCKIFSITRQTLHTWIKEKVLVQYKVKSRCYFLKADLERLIANNPLS